MKNIALLLFVFAVAIVGCNKDEDGADTATLKIKTKLQSVSTYQSGVNIKIYQGTGGGQLVAEGLTDNTGEVVLSDLSAGAHTIVGNYTRPSNGGVCSNTYNIVLDKGSNSVEMVLSCVADTSTSNCTITCANGTLVQATGVCTCQCDNGYEGSLCDSLERDKFLGTFAISETCPSGTYAGSVSIYASSSADRILIDNFGGFGAGSSFVVTAVVDGSNLNIPAQTVNTVTINSGSGSINNGNDIITISYNYTISGQSETCSGTYTRQ